MICNGLISCNGFLDLGVIVAAGLLVAAFTLRHYGSKKLGWVFVVIAVLVVFVSLLAEIEQGPRYDRVAMGEACGVGYECIDEIAASLMGYENCVPATCRWNSPQMLCCPIAQAEAS